MISVLYVLFEILVLLIVSSTLPEFFWSSHPFQVFAMLETTRGIWHRGLSLITQISCRGLHLGPLAETETIVILIRSIQAYASALFT